MKVRQTTLLAVATLATLSGCASMSAADCKGASWYQLGWRDGEISWYSALDKYSTRCSPYGVQPDAARYETGRANGQFDRAHRLGDASQIPSS